MTTRIWVGALLTVFVALTITAHVRWAARAGAADVPGEMAPNEFGVAESVHRTGLVDRSNPFFLELGVNGRTCESCHDGRAGWTITPAFARRLFKASDGLAALFRIHDAGSPPRRRHREARREAFATVLERGVTRFLRTIPATADFEVIAVDDPYEFSTPAQFSNFRRCVRHSMPLTRAGSLDLRGARCALCRRLLGWPASESGRLCRRDRGHGRGHRRRRALMLAILYPHVLKAEVPMKRALAILGSAIFLVIAPGTLAGYGPWAICRWRMAPPFFGFFPIRMVGVLLIAAGLPVLLDSFGRFAIQGLGTPAPVAPPQRLVVTGLYRYVRNPIYVAVVSLIFGQGLFFSSVGVLEYGLAVWLGFFAWVLIFEEPTLREKFGKDYEDYCARVPRWIPRLRR